MTGEQPPSGQAGPLSGAPPGLLENLGELCGAGLAYLQARLSLAGLEAKEALLHLAVVIGLIVVALAVIIYGYLFLCIAVTLLIAHLLHVSPAWVILALAVLHFAVAAGSILFAVARLKSPMFSTTLAELKKDQQWLSQKSK
jgi:uncharacterized membrane protein YqjE